MINKKLKIFVIISLIIAIVEVLMIIHIKKETKQVASEKTDENDKYIYDEMGVFRNDNQFLDNLNNYLDGKMYEDSSKAFQNLYSWFQSTLNKEVELLTSREPYLSLYSNITTLLYLRVGGLVALSLS